MTADAQGAALGKKIAKYRQEHYFQPTDQERVADGGAASGQPHPRRGRQLS